MDRGYTLLWRKVWDNPVLKNRGKRFSRLEAWLYLVNVAARGVPSLLDALSEFNFSGHGSTSIPCPYLAVSQWKMGALYLRI